MDREKQIVQASIVNIVGNVVLAAAILGSAHVTVDGQMTVAEFDDVARRVREHTLKSCGVTLEGITPYPDVRHDESAREARATAGRIL